MSSKRANRSGTFVLSAATVSATVKTRSNFAVRHLITAATFARMSCVIEEENKGLPFGAFYEDIVSFVTGAIMFSVASLEANINEIFIDGEQYFTEMSPESRTARWLLAEKKSVLDKHDLAITLKCTYSF